MAEPVKKKRKLPSLADSFDSTQRETDSPEFHQGRKRVHSHVQGQWASHIYLEFLPSAALQSTLEDLIKLEQKQSYNETIHSLLPKRDGEMEALHLSLSKPLLLQTNQREQLRKIVQDVSVHSTGFEASFATLSTLENDELTRRFLSVEIGAGYSQMNALVKDLTPHLVKMRLPPYYDDPRFHSSIAWSSITSKSVGMNLNAKLPWTEKDLLVLDKDLEDQIRKESSFVGEIILKIGQDVYRYPFGK